MKKLLLALLLGVAACKGNDPKRAYLDKLFHDYNTFGDTKFFKWERYDLFAGPSDSCGRVVLYSQHKGEPEKGEGQICCDSVSGSCKLTTSGYYQNMFLYALSKQKK